MIIEEIQKKYALAKENNVDNLLIKIGIVGVVVGLAFSISFINQLFAWVILLGCAMKLYDFVIEAEKKLDYKKEESSSFIDDVQKNWAMFKEKEGDTLLIKIGIVGVVIGLAFSVSFINQFFAWFILLGCAIKLYDYVAETKKNMVASKEENLG